jgi:CheY-like chemotaxis protein
MKNKEVRVLVVDDSTEDRELTLAALRECKMVDYFDVLSDGVEIIDYLHCRGAHANRDRSYPNMILLDLKMPKVGGFEVLRRLKADRDLRTIPVVILSSSNEEKDLVMGYGLGANAYIVKPVNFYEFVQKVKDLAKFWLKTNEAPPMTNGVQSETR